MQLARRFATSRHLLDVFSDQISPRITLKAAFERLSGQPLAASWAATRLSGYQGGPLFHTTASCAPSLHDRAASLAELVDEPVCQRCSWLDATAPGKVLTLVSKWFAVIDAPPAAFAPTWRNALLLHALANPRPAELPAGNGGLLMPIRRLVVDKAQAAIDAARATHGLSVAHRHLSALALPMAVTPDRARDFAKWAANTAAFSTLGAQPAWDMELVSLPRDTVQFIALRSNAGPAWAASVLSEADYSAVCSFYPALFCRHLHNGVVTGELPLSAISGLGALGFHIVPAIGHSQDVLEMAARLFEPGGSSELSDLATALKAASAVAM